MALSTYTELKAALADWLHRTDLTSQIVDFIDLAEVEINSEIRTRQMQVDETLSLTSGTKTVALPSRYIDPISLELVITGENNTPLFYVSPQNISSNTATSSRPVFWTINGDNIEFEYLADQTYSLSFRMLKGYDLAATETNDLLTKYPGLYLFGALLQAAPYMVDDQRIGTWQNSYDKALSKAKKVEGRNSRLVTLRTEFPLSGASRNSNIITG